MIGLKNSAQKAEDVGSFLSTFWLFSEERPALMEKLFCCLSNLEQSRIMFLLVGIVILI